MPTYIYRVRRKGADAPVFNAPGRPSHEPREAPEPSAPQQPEPSYRELQVEAKNLGIPANKSADELKEAISEHTSDE